MEGNIKLVDQIYWVGVNDRETPLFESIWRRRPERIMELKCTELGRKVASAVRAK
jgi:hypothetical protein